MARARKPASKMPESTRQQQGSASTEMETLPPRVPKMEAHMVRALYRVVVQNMPVQLLTGLKKDVAEYVRLLSYLHEQTQKGTRLREQKVLLEECYKISVKEAAKTHGHDIYKLTKKLLEEKARYDERSAKLMKRILWLQGRAQTLTDAVAELSSKLYEPAKRGGEETKQTATRTKM